MLLLHLREVLLSHSCGNSRPLLALLRGVSALQNKCFTLTRTDPTCLTTGAAVQPSDLSQQHQRQYNSFPSSTSNCLQAVAYATWPLVGERPQFLDSVNRTTAGLQAGAAAAKYAALQAAGAGAQLRRSFAASLETQAGSGADGTGPLDAAEQARNITRAIKSAQSLQQLQQIVQEAGSSLNPIHASAALNAAARLARRSTVTAADAASAAGLQDTCSSSSSGNALQDAAAAELLDVLLPGWLSVLQEARPRELASVLYSAAKLHCANEQLWSATLAAFMQPECVKHANAQDLSTVAYALATAGVAQKAGEAAAAAAGAGAGPSSSSSGGFSAVPGVAVEQVQLALQVVALQLAVLLSGSAAAASDNCQSIVKVLWAHAKLSCTMGGQELVLLLQTLVQPSLLLVADAQALANTMWAVSELQQLPAWQQQQQEQKQAAQQALQQVLTQLLSPVQLRKIARGSPQAVANSLLALGRLAAGGSGQHVIAVPFAQQCALELLEGPVAHKLHAWSAHDISTAMSACGKLGCRAMGFFRAAAAASNNWLPHTTARDLAEVAWACTRLRFKDPQLMADVMQHGRQLMHRTRGHGMLLPAQEERTDLAATLSGAVTALKMAQLAGDVKALVASAGIKQQEEPLSANIARTLWRVHGWLLHEHPKAHGLTKLLTEQQQAICAEASRHTHRASPPAHVAVQLLQQQQPQQQAS